MTNHSPNQFTTDASIPAMAAQICQTDTAQLLSAFDTLLGELRSRSDADRIAIIWQTDDVQMQRPDLTEEQCQEVLHRLNRHHDATIGINWAVIDCAADHCYLEPDNLAELRELAEAD